MSDATAPDRRRPVTVTVALVFLYLSGLSSAATGVLIMLSRYRVEPAEILPVSLLGAGVILFGLLTLAVTSGLSRGNGLSRVLVTVYVSIALVLQVVTIVATDDWDWSGLVIIAAQVFVPIALWAPPGSRWFRSVAAAQATRAVA